MVPSTRSPSTAGAARANHSLSRYLQELDLSFVVVHGDDYNEANGSAWFGLPSEELKRRDLFDPVRRGSRLVTPRRYDWTAKRFAEPREILVRTSFCFEECFAFEYPVDWDVMLWVEVSRQESFDRAVRRETAENGWDAPAERYLNEWRQWQIREDAYIARVDPARVANAVLDGLRPWADQIA